ncbi:1,4-alpha-glucan branching enzyme [Limnofasciculus baicalensis]|uniref:1,4-alpha-glucan branching enzyme GlgB n=1 Tax=Limnofasciculus baicalensis BBK-W-15 TaxID=2699891 RepID=A0AAE3GWS7_9CYAN|nr:1,4-alpha-glucan branching enzyme [Limnofasciculus baicalensis]MCP2731502.1 1,4-alpha-glucan branching enzyme [Limnofasciculus baicalensis BBK-W-15]
MSHLISPDQIDRIVWNQHQDPFEVLGPHSFEQDGKTSWIVRAYLPNADAVWVVRPEQREEYPMQSVHHPHFFECLLEVAELPNYQLKIKEGSHERVIYDPYAFRSPLLTEFDLYLFGKGDHHRIYEKLGAHVTEIDGIKGVYFAVWAPNARNVSILGDFNNWDGRQHQMRKGGTGIWDLFIPELGVGEHYKYEIKNYEGHIYEKSDPYGFQQEVRPKTASIVTELDNYSWNDSEWMEKRRNTDALAEPISVYEVHLGSWLNAASGEPAKLPNGETEPVVVVSELRPGARFLTYRELAAKLIPYVKELGFTHIELLPIAEHPFDGSWGYQVTGYYACTSRFGTPDDFMYFVDQCHQNGIGVIVDWVPGHFPKDGHGLAFFDGSHLYEHADPRKGEHKEWGTLVFNYNRNEVRNFLVANALFWFDKYHIDGIRVDAVASMLYLDYCRKPGEWVTNQYGGRENIEAADFLRQTNHVIFSYFPGVLSIAEESTDWPMVSWPTYVGGLGFNLKWNMGWMHDMLDYFSMDPWFRQFHQNNITFSMWYNHSENYMLALSHDEVVHGKSNMIGKMPGDEWQKFANVRTLFAYMFAHPGKKTLFMSMEFGQWSEWNVWADLEWKLLQYEPHQKLKGFVSALNKLYQSEPALYSNDFAQEGFQWIDCSDNRHSVVSFIRRAKDPGEFIIAVCNFTPQPHSHYRVGVPEMGFYTELFNSDSREYGGSNMGNLGGKWTDEWSFHNLPYSLDLCLPPLSVLILKLDRKKTAAALASSVG